MAQNRVEHSPTKKVFLVVPEVQKLSQFAVICTILNRTIGMPFVQIIEIYEV